MGNHAVPPARTFAESTSVEKERINDAVDKLIASLSDSLGLCREAVANVAFYRLQRHTQWGRNATMTHSPDDQSSDVGDSLGFHGQR
jgi:hypothetical protein